MGDAFNKPFQPILLNAKIPNENLISKRQAKAKSNAMDEEPNSYEDTFYSVNNSNSTSVERTTKKLLMEEVTPLKKKTEDLDEKSNILESNVKSEFTDVWNTINTIQEKNNTDSQNMMNPDQNSDFQNQLNNLGQSICGLENGQSACFEYMNESKGKETHLYQGLNDMIGRLDNIEAGAGQILNDANLEIQKINENVEVNSKY